MWTLSLKLGRGEPGVAVHVCNPSAQGGRDRRISEMELWSTERVQDDTHPNVPAGSPTVSCAYHKQVRAAAVLGTASSGSLFSAEDLRSRATHDPSPKPRPAEPAGILLIHPQCRQEVLAPSAHHGSRLPSVVVLIRLSPPQNVPRSLTTHTI